MLDSQREADMLKGGIREILSLLVLIALMTVVAGGVLAHESNGSTPAPVLGTSMAPASDSDRTDLFNEGFEGSFPPAGWEVINLGNTHTWAQTSSKAHSGTYSAWVNYGVQGTSQDEWLVLPAIDLSTVGAAYLEFYEDQAYWPGYGEHHYIAVSTTSQTDTASFTTLVDWTPANHSIDEGFAGDPVTVSLLDYVGESVVYVAFRYTGSYADDWYIDDVRIYEPFAHDIAVLSISPDDEQCVDGQLIGPEVVVENKGANLEDIGLVLTIHESGVEVYNEGVNMQLDVGEQQTVAMPGFFVTAGNYYEFEATSILATDMDTSNDTAQSTCDSYTQVHVPLGWMHTNAGCSYCAPAEDYFDAWLPGQGDDVAMIRVHTWWPNGGDILYLHNAAQNQTLVPQWGYDYTPHFWLDGVQDCGSTSAQYTTLFEQRKSILSPGCIDLTWRPGDSTAVACVNVKEPLNPAGDYRLKVCITEDDYYFAGGNGHNTHHQALRRMLPTEAGLVVSPTVGPQSFEVPVTIPAYWTEANLNVTAFLQDETSWRVWQASTGDTEELVGQVAIDPPVSSVNTDDQLVLAVDITPAQGGVKSVDLTFDFDETYVRLDSITAGEWATTSGLTFIFTDHTPTDDTVAHFDLSFTDGVVADPGTVAYCHFTGVGTADGAMALPFTGNSVLDVNDTPLGFVTSSGDSMYVVYDPTPAGDAEAPALLRLVGNAPNPFNPSTMIRFDLPEPGRWNVSIYDVEGRLQRVLLNEEWPAGRHELQWDGRDDRGESLGSGVYLVRVSGAAGNVCGKMLLLK